MPIYTGEHIDEQGKRFYVDENETKYVSVTTLLSHYEDKTTLEQWKERIGEEEAEKIKNEAADRGKEAHSEIEHYLEHGVLSSEIETPSPYAVVSIDNFYKHITAYKQEEVVFLKKHPVYVAGRYDQLVNLPNDKFIYKDTGDPVKGGLILADLKTKVKSPRFDKLDYVLKYLLQLGMYARMIERTSGERVEGACLVFAVHLKTKDKCQMLYVNRELLDFYWYKASALILDYFNISKYNGSWKSILQEAHCTYDFDTGQFLNYLPKEICSKV